MARGRGRDAAPDRDDEDAREAGRARGAKTGKSEKSANPVDLRTGSKPPKSSKTPDPLDLFDLAGSDPDTLSSGRIPDPQPAHTPLFRFLARVLTGVEERLRARGGPGLRVGIRAVWVAIAVIGAFLLVGPIINKPMEFEEVIESAQLSEVDWVARDATVRYDVSRDADGGFRADVAETFTADFLDGAEPSIRRTIVTEYEGRDVEFELAEVTIDGERVEAEVDRRATTTGIRITPPGGGEFTGQHEVTYAYELHHLTTVETEEATGKTVDRWDWPLFAPTWPQATSGIDVTIAFAPELDDALIRQPQAYVGWLLLAETAWLEPEGTDPDGAVLYSFSNDQNLPPNADLWIQAGFAEGTFARPDTTTLFWWQTYGPLLPMAVLLILVPFAIAARRIVWADSAGDPWYSARSEPPKGVSPEFAARLLQRPWHGELVASLAQPPKSVNERGRRTWLVEAARAGRRAGRLGTLPAVLGRAVRWSADDTVVERKLRWVPRGYVRDAFVLAPIAIVLLQWGLLRQLSEQTILAAIWWPATFVLASTALAILTLAIVRTPRPLTREGALVVQQLRGIDAYADTTRLLDRGPIDEPLLPYAALFARPRRAGRAVEEHAIAESGDRRIADGWRTQGFISGPALLATVLALGVLAASITTVASLPQPYSEDIDFATEHHEVPGTLYTDTTGFDLSGELSRDEAGRARLDVVERHEVRFEEGAPRPPQFAREWPVERHGQDLGFAFESIRIDGEEVPTREIDGPSTVAVATALEEVLQGEHEIEVRYALESPAVETRSGVSGRAEVEQVRWSAMLSFWEDDYTVDAGDSFGDRALVRPLRISFELAPGLVEEMRDGGWIDRDSDLADVPFEDGNTAMPWEYDVRYLSERDDELHDARIGSWTERADGSAIAVIDLSEVGDDIDKYGADLSHDLGVLVDFPPGTFTGIDAGASAQDRLDRTLPFAVVLSLAGLVIVGSIVAALAAVLPARGAGSSLRLVSWGALPILAIAQAVLNAWAILPMPGSDGRGAIAIVLGCVMWLAVVVQAVVVGKRSPRPAPVRKDIPKGPKRPGGARKSRPKR